MSKLIEVTAAIAHRDRTLQDLAKATPTADAKAHLDNFRRMAGIPANASPVTAGRAEWQTLDPDARRSKFPLMREGRLYA